MIVFGYVLSSVQSTVLQLCTPLHSSNDHTHEHEHPQPCALYVRCNEYHTNTPYTPYKHIHMIGSYEKTGWTDQLSRPKKKPRTRFQTLPTSPGGPIIGKGYTVRIDLMMFHTCWFLCLKMKESFELLMNTTATTIFCEKEQWLFRFLFHVAWWKYFTVFFFDHEKYSSLHNSIVRLIHVSSSSGMVS